MYREHGEEVELREIGDRVVPELGRGGGGVSQVRQGKDLVSLWRQAGEGAGF